MIRADQMAKQAPMFVRQEVAILGVVERFGAASRPRQRLLLVAAWAVLEDWLLPVDAHLPNDTRLAVSDNEASRASFRAILLSTAPAKTRPETPPVSGGSSCRVSFQP